MDRTGKTVSLGWPAAFYLQREIALLLGLLYAHGACKRPDWKSSTVILDARILSAFVDGALNLAKAVSTTSKPTARRTARHGGTKCMPTRKPSGVF